MELKASWVYSKTLSKLGKERKERGGEKKERNKGRDGRGKEKERNLLIGTGRLTRGTVQFPLIIISSKHRGNESLM